MKKSIENSVAVILLKRLLQFICVAICAAIFIRSAYARPVEGANSTASDSRETRDKGTSSRETRDKGTSSRETRDKGTSSREARDKETSSRETRDKETSSRETKGKETSASVTKSKETPASESTPKSAPNVNVKELTPKLDINKTEFERAAENANAERERQEREKAQNEMRNNTHEGVERIANKANSASIGLGKVNSEASQVPSDNKTQPEVAGGVTVRANTEKPDKK